MSQVIVFTGSGGGGGGSVDTLTGNTGGAVSPSAGNINVVGDAEFTTVTGTPGTHTLTVTLLNTDIGTVTTVDATPHVTLLPIPVPVGTAVTAFFDVLGVKSDISEVSSGFAQGAAINTGAGAVLIGTPVFGESASNFATAEFDLITVGGNLVLVVTGEAATTINWTATARFIES